MTVACTLALLVASVAAVASTSSAQAATHDGRFIATLELREGEIDFPVEEGVLQIFDEDDAPFMVQVLDGCAVNGNFWVFAASLTDAPITISVFDRVTGTLRTLVMPAYAAGAPIQVVFDPDALAACGDQPLGGLPELTGTATYTAATAACDDDSAAFRLQSNGEADAYRSYVRRADARNEIVSTNPVVTIDQDKERDELHLMVEGRTPRRIEGVVFSGPAGMLPKRAKLDRGLATLTRGRVRRAFEAAKNERLPDLLIEDLGLKRVTCVYHVSLEFATPGASVYLDSAGWIEDGGTLPEPAPLVEPRFAVAVIAADGGTTPLPLVGPAVGSDGDGRLWRYADGQTIAQVVDNCDLSGSYWTFAASVAEGAAQLVLTDARDGEATSYAFDARGDRAAALADSSTLRACS
ncbi:MAG: hypothetical protein ACC726_14755 [Chloroflexota bacterium]